MSEVVINGEDLTFEQVVSVAYGKPGEPNVLISDEAKANVNRSSAAVDALLDRVLARSRTKLSVAKRLSCSSEILSLATQLVSAIRSTRRPYGPSC
jgi:ABC-type transport system involved in Fe-S cluster assembly fused permease/ATPase subunit